MSEELKSCPFCDGLPILDKYQSSDGSIWYSVSCSCGLETGWYNSEKKVLSFWNKAKIGRIKD